MQSYSLTYYRLRKRKPLVAVGFAARGIRMTQFLHPRYLTAGVTDGYVGEDASSQLTFEWKICWIDRYLMLYAQSTAKDHNSQGGRNCIAITNKILIHCL